MAGILEATYVHMLLPRIATPAVVALDSSCRVSKTLTTDADSVPSLAIAVIVLVFLLRTVNAKCRTQSASRQFLFFAWVTLLNIRMKPKSVALSQVVISGTNYHVHGAHVGSVRLLWVYCESAPVVNPYYSFRLISILRS